MNQPKTVLITGASAGIGRALADCFAAAGYALVLTARRTETLQELSHQLEHKYAAKCQVIGLDLARPAAAQELFGECSARGLAIDVLVNNAGFGLNEKFMSAELDRQLQMVQLNVTALVQLTHLFLPAMLNRGRGGVLNVASTAAFQPGPYMAVYYASKAFVLSFSEALAVELAKTPLTVSCLCPGPTATEFQQTAKMRSTTILRLLGNQSAERVARCGFEGFQRGKLLIVPGAMNRLGIAVSRLLPRRGVRQLIASVNKK